MLLIINSDEVRNIRNKEEAVETCRQVLYGHLNKVMMKNRILLEEIIPA
jgi:hypothetical protein